MKFIRPRDAGGDRTRGGAANIRVISVAALAAAACAALAVPAIAAVRAPSVHTVAAHAATKHSTKTTVSAGTAYLSASVTLSAKVTGAGSTPTGKVTFSDGRRTLCSARLSHGKAHCSTKFTSSGTHHVKGSYAGNSSHKSSSGTASVKVSKAPTTTTVTASTKTPYPGQSVTVTAKVSSASTVAAAGNVTFSDKSGTLCSNVSLSGGKAVCAYTWPAAGGPFTVTAAYAGNSSHSASQGAVGPVTVARLATTTAITNPTITTQLSGQPFIINVQVTSAGGGVPTGTVDVASLPQQGILAAGAYTCTVTLTAADNGAGNCSITTPTGAYGFVTFQATYGGDTAHIGSASYLECKLINRIPTTTTVAPATATSGSKVTLTATVVPEDNGNLLSAFSETLPDVVNFTVNGAAVCSNVAITWTGTNDIATCSYTPPAAGSYAVVATFPGDEYAMPSAGTETLVAS
jgi:large repetitive protein